MSIQLLDTSVIHQLRSSLIITTLPQCIKELINNAIDANATSIDISLDIEKFSLQVSDNGYGIQNMSKIGQRHVTSKCHTLSDISQLKTFGFRGEALASITNESMVQIISRHHLSKDTFEGFWRDGRIISDTISHSKHTRKSHPGTTVIVRDLFYKYPVRRRYLSSYQHVVIMESVKRLIINFALCFHHINFNLVDSARNSKIMMVKKSNTDLDVFRQLFGHEIIKDIKSLDMHEANINVEGFFSSRGYPNKSHQYIFINNFFVPNDKELYKIVASLFSKSSFLPPLKNSAWNSISKQNTKACMRASIQKYPIYLIKLTCPDWSYYDIYRHLEIVNEFSAYPVIKHLVNKFATQFLQLAGLLVTKVENGGKKRPRSTASDPSKVSKYVQHSASSVITSASSTTSSRPDGFISWWDDNQNKLYYIDPHTGNSYPAQTQNSIDRSHLKRLKPNKHQRVMPVPDVSSDSPLKLSKSDLKHAQVLGQVDKKYIVIKLNESLIMIDQHAADERVKLEQMMKPSSLNPTTLEPSICIELESSFEYHLVTEKLSYFKLWGIHIVVPPETSHFFTSKSHPNRVYVTQLPSLILDRCVINHTLLKDLIRDYAYWIKEQSQESSINKTCPKGIMEILKSRACRNAIMFNDVLTLKQCKDIVEKLSNCHFPFQCAHGRPSTIPIQPKTQGMHAPKRKINWNNSILKR